MKFPKLEAARQRLADINDKLTEAFAEAGPDMDLDNVTCLGPDVDVVAEVERLTADQAEVQAEVTRLEKVATAASNVRSLEPPAAAPATPSRRPRSLGDAVVTDEKFKALANRGSRFSTGLIEVKNESAGVDPISTVDSDVVQPQVAPGIVDIRLRRLTVAQLMPQGQTSSNSIKSIVETVLDNNAEAVAELGEKPQSYIEYDDKDEPVRKIAHYFKVSDEALSDLPFLRTQINSRGTLLLQHAEEDQLLNGTGDSPNLEGILERDGLVDPLSPQGTDTLVDTIHRQLTVIRTESLLEPDAIVIHPATWEEIRLSKDDNEQYYAGGPFTGPYGNGGIAGDSLWGMRVVPTSVIDEDTVLVGAFQSSAQVYRNGGISVEATNSDQDDFIHNRVTIRFEERLALVVNRPQGFGVVSLGS